MTRLEYWIRAQTQYSVHSPFVFDLYREVLFAEVAHASLPPCRWGSRRYSALCYKLKDHFGLTTIAATDQQAVFSGTADFGMVLVVNHPHRDNAAEQRWADLCRTEPYRVSIDLYDVGLLFTNPRLHRQHFLLK